MLIGGDLQGSEFPTLELPKTTRRRLRTEEAAILEWNGM